MRSSELPSPEPPPLGSDDDPVESAAPDERPWNFAALVRSELTVLYANPQLDITNKVIVAYDKQFK